MYTTSHIYNNLLTLNCSIFLVNDLMCFECKHMSNWGAYNKTSDVITGWCQKLE